MQDNKKRVTIKQVAAASGVTIATVSNVINGTAGVREETAQRVKDAIKELHYVPNMTAKSLRSKKNKSIAILVPDLNNGFYYRMLSNFTNLAFGSGYVVQIFGYENSVNKEYQIMDSLICNNISIVILVSGYGDEGGIKKLLDAGKKVILADRSSDIPGVKNLCYDNETEVIKAVKFLKEKGYRRIGYLTEKDILQNVVDRKDAFKKAIEIYGMSDCMDNIFMLECDSVDILFNGYQYVKKLLGEKKKSDIPEVFLTSSDLLAIGAMGAFKEFGYRIPEDVGIIGFDNIDISYFVEPKLTTIEQNQEDMAQELFRLTKALYEDEEINDEILLPQKFIIRESC